MNDNYLIPANTKKGQLILSIFRPFDLYLFIGGVLVTFILIAFMPLESTAVTILCVAPALICAFLVMPVPYYHNMLVILMEAYTFLTSRQRYRWKGWCYKNVSSKKRSK